MGKSKDSFDREIGKNAGKAVSNFLFGNKHATPIRLVRDAKIDSIQEQQRIESELLEKRQQLEIREEERAKIEELTIDIDSKVSTIFNMPFPTTENEFVVMMNDLKSYIYVHGWKPFIGLNSYSGQQNRLSNKLSNVILKKINQGLVIMERDFPNNIEFKSYKSFSKTSKTKKFVIQFWFILLPLIFIISIYILDCYQRNF